MQVRPANRVELAYLQGRLASTDREQVDLAKSIVYVVVEESVILGFVAGHLSWRVEPLMVFPEFQKKAPASVQRRVAYLLGRAIDKHIGHSVCKTYFAFVNKAFSRLALRFGMKRIPEEEVVLERSFSDGT